MFLLPLLDGDLSAAVVWCPGDTFLAAPGVARLLWIIVPGTGGEERERGTGRHN